MCQLVWAKAELPIEAFSSDVKYENIQISPSGEYLSFISKIEGKSQLITYSLKQKKPLHAVNFPANGQVGDYVWVNDKRIVLEKQYLRGWQDHPQYHGELFAVNVDGTKGRYLIGYQGEQQTGTRIKKNTPIYGTSYILDPLLDDDKHMLVMTWPWVGTDEPATVVYKVNVVSGKRTKVTLSPAPLANMLTDQDGNVRISVSSVDYNNPQVHIRDVKSKKWQEFKLPDNYIDVGLQAFDESGDKVFITASDMGQPRGVYELDLKTQKITKLFKDKDVSPRRVWVDQNSGELFAVELEPGYPTYAFVGSESKFSARLKSLLKSLPGHQIQLVSSTESGDKTVVRAYSDRNPGVYYLFDAKTNQLSFLFRARTGIKPELMAENKPIQFQTRDGLTISGYLTLPAGKEAKNLPLVVMPHGGPHGPRDYWGFDSTAQLLANRGMAVLKVNFRGSGGYGSAFMRSGYKKWGAEIQYDIIDGVKYVIEQGYADPKNMCIMGASFGGYSALQSAIIEPDMFKCAVGVIGIYDLPQLYTEGDVSERDNGIDFLKDAIGTDEKQLKAFSPVYNIEKLKAPVLIVHGGEDRRAPIEQAESLVDALKKANHPYELMLLKDEGHGFYKPEHRSKYFEKALAFLDEHLAL